MVDFDIIGLCHNMDRQKHMLSLLHFI